MTLLGDLGVYLADGFNIGPFEGVLALSRVLVVVMSCSALFGVKVARLSEGLVAERFRGEPNAGVEGVVPKSE